MWVGLYCLTKLFKLQGKETFVGLYVPGVKEDEDAPVRGINITDDEKFLEYVSKYNGESSNGRTFGSEPNNVGSIPTSPS